MLCPVPYCGKPMRRPRMGMCTHCQKVFHKSTVPHAGFIPVTTLRKIARSILKTHGASKSDIEMALRIARGTRHREGPWEQRPPYRLTPLLTGSPAKRRPQLLVGRRRKPSMEACVMSLVQKVLCEEVLETGTVYAHTLAGMTYFSTRGLYAAPGDKPDQGPSKFSKYRLNHQDFGLVATQALKACKAIGLNPKDSSLRGMVVTSYLSGLDAGNYQDAIYPPKLAMRTSKIGDHPLDFRMPRMPWVEPHLRGKIVRAGGTLGRKPIELKPMLPNPKYRSAIHHHQQIAKVFPRQPVREPVSTDWIFAKQPTMKEADSHAESNEETDAPPYLHGLRRGA